MFRKALPLLAASVYIAAAADVHIVEEIVAKVNSDIITRGELSHTRQEILDELRQQGLSGAKLEQAANQKAADSLRDHIDQLLLVQKAKDLNINVDSEITKRLAEMQVQSKITDEDKFHDFIREQMGMPYEDFRQQVKNQLLTQRVIGEEVSSHVVIPEPEKRKYYDEHKNDFVRDEQIFLQQILIGTEGKTPEQAAAAEKKAKDLVARARKGEKFADLAATNSDDLETARNGGELPGYKRGQLIKQIEDVVWTQKKGYITDPIRVPTGFLILRVVDRYEKGLATYEEVENEINERMIMPQMQTKVRTYLTRLRTEAFLEIKPGYVDSGAAPGKDTVWRDVAQLKPQTVTKEEVATHRKRKKLLWVVPIPWTGGTVKKPAPQSTPAPAAAPAPATAATPPRATAPSQP